MLALALWASAASAASVTLHWTAPGDDSLSGTASQYDLRYAVFAITQSNFFTATQWPTIKPLPAGSKESYTITGLVPNTVYCFRLRTEDKAGNWSALSNLLLLSPSDLVGVEDPNAPNVVQFSAPQPNPARGSAAFTLALPTGADVHVAAYDVQGRTVRTLLSGPHPAGQERIVWNLDDDGGRQVSSGMYLVRARIGDHTLEQRVTVVR